MKIITAWMGRGGGYEFPRRDGTVEYNDLFVSWRDGTVNENCHDVTGRYVKIVTTWRDVYICSTGRNGVYSFWRRDGTVYNFFHDGKRRCCFFFDGTGRYVFFCTTGRDGICFFHCTGELLSAPRQQWDKLKLYLKVRRIISYIMCSLSIPGRY